MGVPSEPLDKWRDYFRSSSSDIFDIIEHAILVAVSDCPQEFRMKRDRIAEALFSYKLAKCIRCDSVELAVPGDEEEDGGGCKSVKFLIEKFEGGGAGGGSSKESKMNNCRDEQVVMNVNQVISLENAEALTDEIEKESQIVGEISRIKGILDNYHDESDTALFDSLRRLQLMVLSVDLLKATEIGKSVNTLRKHSSKEISHFARTLIEVWKDMVDEWVNATEAVKEAVKGKKDTPESVNPSAVVDEEGLPSPPLDEGAFFATTTIELSKFFDGMDDDGNPRNSGEFNKNCETDRKPPKENRNVLKQKPPCEAYVPILGKKGEEMKKQVAVVKPNKPLFNTESRPARPTKVVNVEKKVLNEVTTVQKKPLAIQQEKFLDDNARLEATKRKLHERYQQAENAKRQRTIQVVELHDIPKQWPVCHGNANTRPGNHNRHLANGRR